VQPPAAPVTALLQAWSAGDSTALDQLIPLVHSELRRMARRYMRRERAGHTLQTTALLHEAYLRLVDAHSVDWQNRAHFFGIAARVMRRVLVDVARERGYQKRGGGSLHVTLDESLLIAHAPDADLVALDDGLNALAAVDPRKSRAIELRFFGGLSIEEAALVLEVSPETVKRDCRLAKAWLLRWLTEHGTR
jgi:RNA polymerase sigma-70 factor (ECF subfamily)